MVSGFIKILFSLILVIGFKPRTSGRLIIHFASGIHVWKFKLTLTTYTSLFSFFPPSLPVMYVHVHLCVHVCVQRPKVDNIRSLSVPSHLLVCEAGALAERGAHRCVGRLAMALQRVPWSLPSASEF